MKIYINKAHYPVTVLGPGRRLGIWLQGCTIHCPGCLSQDTWAFTEDSALPVDLFLELCRSLTGGVCPEGFTISGGEPFCQPEALEALLLGLDAWRKEAGCDADILCYSGFTFQQLEQKTPHLLRLLDILIPEPFAEQEGEGLELRGSNNQPLLPLTPLGERLYSSLREAPRQARMQVLADDVRLWHIGIPYRDALTRYEDKCRDKGLILENVSWRA